MGSAHLDIPTQTLPSYKDSSRTSFSPHPATVSAMRAAPTDAELKTRPALSKASRDISPLWIVLGIRLNIDIPHPGWIWLPGLSHGAL